MTLAFLQSEPKLTDTHICSDALTEYAAGTLTPARHLMVACQAEISDSAAQQIQFEENVAAALLDDVRPSSLSPLFIGNVLAHLPTQPAANDHLPSEPSRQAPPSLRTQLGHGLRDIHWKSMVPGVAVHDVIGNRRTRTGERVYLLRAKGGMTMPEHSHTGEEWTLILSGSYSVGETTYRRGDLHIEDEHETHAPYINEGEDCICLVMTDGPLVMKPWLARLIQPIVGI